MQTKKTDNHNPASKLALRHYFLAKYHRPPAELHVIDCCQGSGRLWAELERDFPPTSYFGVDLKPQKGRLKIDSVRILDQPGWTANVIDIDTYGSPWKHWLALLRNCAQPATVFLTIGLVRVGGGNFDHALLPLMGLTFKQLELPNALGAKLDALALAHALSQPGAHGLRAVEAMEAPNQGNARYLGIRLERAKS